MALPTPVLFTAITLLASSALSAANCPAPFHDRFDSRHAYRANWTEDTQGMPGADNAGEFHPSKVKFSRDHVEIEHRGHRHRVRSGHISTRRQDFHFGEYRFLATLPNNYEGLGDGEGFVFGMFLYGQPWDENEIDIEYIYRNRQGREEPANTFRVATHTPGRSASTRVLHQQSQCIGAPCWYSFRWFPDRIEYFINDTFVAAFDGGDVPRNPGRIIINFWSGNPTWGGTHPTDRQKRYGRVHQVAYEPFCPDP